MCITRLSPALITALLCVSGAGAVDLTKVERTIRHEPAYKAKPKYCLLVFGPKAKQRVWLVLDADVLYVDRNGNGDLTEKGKRAKAPEFKPSDHPAHAREATIEAGTVTVEGFTHTDLQVSLTQYRRKVAPSVKDPAEWQGYLDSIWRKVPGGLVYMVSIQLDPRCYARFGDAQTRRVLHFAWIDQQGQLAFADRPQDAPVLHFGGPLSLRVNPAEKLCRGSDPGRTTLCLGTPGLGAGSFVTMSYDLVPTDVHPVVEVLFPAKKKGEQPLTRKYVLKQRC